MHEVTSWTKDEVIEAVTGQPVADVDYLPVVIGLTAYKFVRIDDEYVAYLSLTASETGEAYHPTGRWTIAEITHFALIVAREAKFAALEEQQRGD